MTDTTMTPSTFVEETIATARAGLTPALIGIAGAAVGVFGMAEVFSTAAIPMCILGLILGRHSGNVFAMGLGAIGVAGAMAGLINSPAFWLVFTALLGAV